MKAELSGSVPEERKPPFKITLTLVVTLITKNPALQHNLAQQNVSMAWPAGQRGPNGVDIF